MMFKKWLNNTWTYKIVVSKNLANIISYIMLIIVFDARSQIYITPLVKKPTLDSNEINNCMPMRNLSVLSKLLKKAVCKQLVSYLDPMNLMPGNQLSSVPLDRALTDDRFLIHYVSNW